VLVGCELAQTRWRRSRPLVDGLAQVADNDQPRMRLLCPQELDALELQLARVLNLVDDNLVEACGQLGLRRALPQQHRTHRGP
jgi:hypothetical protein